ncbi:MAG: EamA family transporter [Proteobacteria bacterium]|nr:MAG: EamA family transporter [Pseudomonadota bacterium]
MNTRNKNILHVGLFFAMFAWGGSWINAKVLSSYINEFEMLFLRFGITALSLVPILFYMRESFKISLKSLGIAFFTSLFFIAYMKYFFIGTKYGTASLGGAFVTSLAPINTFLILAFLRIKSIGKKDYFALFLGFLGVLTMLNVWSFDLNSILVKHNLYFILAAILWPFVTILSSYASDTSPLTFSFYMYIITCLLVLAFFVDMQDLNFEKFDSIFYLNLFTITILASTYANSVYFLGVQKLGADGVSSFIFLVPFFAVLLGVVFLNEKLNLFVIIGAIMTLYAVKILNNIEFRKK